MYKQSGEGLQNDLLLRSHRSGCQCAILKVCSSRYKILTALGPDEGLLHAEANGGMIHLLLTDVIMRIMSGKELGDKIAMPKPGIKTLSMSGYTANELAPQGILKGGMQFIRKPFTPYALAQIVHETLSSKLENQ
ncbi:MAG TPA: response regulator [Candidatus Kryptonia bacterium]